MKKKVLSVLSIIVTAALALSCAAVASSSVSDIAASAVEEIIGYELGLSGASSIQEWIDGELSDNAGKGSEWFVITLARSGKYDLTEYLRSLEGYIAENNIPSATSRQKDALTMIAAGHESPYINETAENSVGKQGIMSMIYGLHLLNNGAECENYTASKLVNELIGMQYDDGGWALMGEHGDIDVTAMTVQALAPNINENKAVSEALERAVVFMSEKQLEDGDYQSFGTKNPESAAQVLIAVSALGIDISDARFVKNGHTLIDGIMKYQLPDGSFTHTEGGNSNKTATVQAFMALTAYRLNAEKGDRFYDLTKSFDPERNTERDNNENITSEQQITTAPETTASSPAVTTKSSGNDYIKTEYGKTSDYKIIAYIIIGAAAAAVCIILFLLKKRRISNFIAVIILAAGAVCFIFFTDFRSKEEYYSGDFPEKTDIVGTVTLTIRCDTIAGKDKNEYVPANGIILDTKEFAIEKGDTVYDILTEAGRKYGIQLESKSGGYVAGINYLYEFDYGDLSGWIYHVNSDAPFVMCSEYELSDGDKIEWLYTCELGNDLM